MSNTSYDEQVAVERERLLACIKRHVREDGTLVDKGGRVVAAHGGTVAKPFPFSREYFLSKFAVDLIAGEIQNLKTGNVYTPNQSCGKKTQIRVDGIAYQKHLLIVWLTLDGTQINQIPHGIVCNHLDVDGGDPITNLELCTNADNATQRSAVRNDSTGYNILIGCKVRGIHGAERKPLSVPFKLAFGSSDSSFIDLFFKTELEMATLAYYLYGTGNTPPKGVTFNEYRRILTERKLLVSKLVASGEMYAGAKKGVCIPDAVRIGFAPEEEVVAVVLAERVKRPQLVEAMRGYQAQGFTGFIAD